MLTSSWAHLLFVKDRGLIASVVRGMGPFRSCSGSLAVFFGDSESQQILILPTNVILVSTICYSLNNEIGSI